MALQAVAADDGVGDEGVRGHDAAQQEGGRGRIAEQGGGHDEGQDEGHEAREQSEDKELPRVALHALQVHLQSGEEHNVVEAHAAEDLKRDVALQDVESVFSDGDTGQHHSDDVGDAQLAHDDRRKQDNHQHHEEDHRGVGNGEICGE